MFDGALTMREARREYFRANDFGENGGYDDAWVDFSLGPIPFPFPNTPARVKAVRFHDLHHVLTEYRTDFVGELEISAWEIGAGCKSMAAAWVLNLGGMAAGLFVSPKRTFRAFVRGRRSDTLYDESFEPLLDETVSTLRAKHVGEPTTSNAFDVIGFAIASLAGLAVALTLFAILIPLLPFGFVARAIKRRSEEAPLTRDP